MIDIRQSESYNQYLKGIGWTVERIGEINYFIKKLPIVGSVLKVQRPDEINFETIDKLCRKYGVYQVVIEPKTELDAKYLSSIGFKLSKNPYLPSKTLQLDLSLSMNRLIDSMKKDTRRIIRKGSDLIIKSYSTPDEIRKWREEWKNSVKLSRYVPPAEQLIKLKKDFPNNHSLFLASHNISGRIIGGALFTTSFHGKSNYITYYWQAFTNKEGRASLSQYSLLYQGILWAKKHGYKVFDFEGIFDPRFPNKTWLGFTHFKRSFGGYEVEYPGCYTKFRFPLRFYMKDTNKVAVCLIQNEKGEYLFIKRTKYKDLGEFQDAWYPPTGHIKKDETVEQALVRELKEELNVNVKPIELLSEWEQDLPGEHAYWWRCKIVGGKVKKSFEILDYKYFTADEIKNLKLWPAERKFFEKFIWNK